MGEKSFALGDPIVTFVSRYLEPLRGFHVFMRAIPLILSKKPDAHIFILGSDLAGAPGIPSYGGINQSGKTWKEEFLHLIKGYEANVHFMGFLPYPKYLSILKLSACHVYLTYPFVLGWSFLEASVIGVPTVASNTPPVVEFAPRLPNVVKMVDFFNHEELAEAVVSVLAEPGKRRPVVIKELDVKNTVVEVEKVLKEGMVGKTKTIKKKEVEKQT